MGRDGRGQGGYRAFKSDSEVEIRLLDCLTPWKLFEADKTSQAGSPDESSVKNAVQRRRSTARSTCEKACISGRR